MTASLVIFHECSARRRGHDQMLSASSTQRESWSRNRGSYSLTDREVPCRKPHRLSLGRRNPRPNAPISRPAGVGTIPWSAPVKSADPQWWGGRRSPLRMRLDPLRGLRRTCVRSSSEQRGGRCLPYVQRVECLGGSVTRRPRDARLVGYVLLSGLAGDERNCIKLPSRQ